MRRLLLIVAMTTTLLVPAGADEWDDEWSSEADRIQERIQHLEMLMGKIKGRLRRFLPDTDLDAYLKDVELTDETYTPDETARARLEAWEDVRDRMLPDASGKRSQSLAAAEIAVRKKEKAYDDFLQERWITVDRPVTLVGWIGGWEKPLKPWSTGLGHPYLREKYKAWQEAVAARQAALARLDKHLAENPVEGFTSYGELTRYVREYEQSYRRHLPGNAQVRRLVVQYIRRRRERDRLQRMLVSHGKFVVWKNDVGWVYVGTKDEFRREHGRARGDEVWGGRSRAPLKSELVIDKEYDTVGEAIRALGIRLGTVRRHLFKLASPRVTFRADLDGKEVKITPFVHQHAAFADYMP